MADVDAIVDSFFRYAARGIYYPDEWRGKLTAHQAYRVQLGLAARHESQGERQAGWKVGLTARAMQEQWGIFEPVFGVLFESGARPSGAVLPFDALIEPGFENELCLTIGAPLEGPGVTVARARAAIVAVAPAFEIIERRGDFTGDLNLALADNSQQKAFVTGPESPLAASQDPARATVEILVNGQRVERNAGSPERTGDPVAAVAWLANKLAEFERCIEPGQRIMSGSFTRQYPLARGDRIEARFNPYGVVTAACR